MNESDSTPAPPAAMPAWQPRRLQFLRIVPWYIYGLRLLLLQPTRFGLMFLLWFLAAQLLASLPYVGLWVYGAYAALTSPGLLWAFHCAASGRRPELGMMLRSLLLSPAVQAFLVAQALLALTLGVVYVVWADGGAALRYLLLSDFAGGTAPRGETLRMFRLIVALTTLWFGYVGLLALLGCGPLRAAIAASVRASLLNFPALVAMAVGEMLADTVQEALPQSLPSALLGLLFTVVLLALSGAAAYASFRDIFRPPEMPDESA